MALRTTESPAGASPLAVHDAGRAGRERRFKWLLIFAVGVGVSTLLALLIDVSRIGVPRVSIDFLTDLPSRFPERAGAMPAIMGSLWVIGVTIMFAVPVGVGAAVYLEEYAEPGRLSRLIEVNISNLAGVPSVVYGLLGLAVFVRIFAFGRSVLAGGLTLGLLVLPVVITASREAIRAVPPSIREGALAVGATRWQTTARQVLPAALPGIMTGVILSVSRALGETAALIILGAVTFIPFAPGGLLDAFTTLPVLLFSWTVRPQHGFRVAAAAGIVVLLVVLLILNTVALVVRNRYERKW